MPDASNNSMGLKGIFSLAATLALAGCAGSGEGLDQNGEPVSPAPPANSDFQEIQATIFTPICTNCHVGANAPQGLRLDAANSYAMIVNVASAEVPALLRVNPGNPDASYLVQKIQGNAAVGGRMPLGGPPLSQAQIDLVRGWVAAGAPQSAAPPAQLKVASSIPAAAESAPAGLDKLTIIFNSEVDAALVAANTFVLRDGFDQQVALASARVPQGRPRVVELQLPRPLAAGSYQLEVLGSGPVALADQAGRVLDGDADGAPGGNALIPFDVNAGAYP
jgi:methionine-rich copper-binding protein CopC